MWGERRRSAEPRASHGIITIETACRIAARSADRSKADLRLYRTVLSPHHYCPGTMWIGTSDAGHQLVLVRAQRPCIDDGQAKSSHCVSPCFHWGFRLDAIDLHRGPAGGRKFQPQLRTKPAYPASAASLHFCRYAGSPPG